jgi:alkanesulfonate monooxygenase SsuD/methylene tetrahydromethanopterin reductase-like flavin-dependent oxidoreductase (luciferase family)
VFLPPLLRLAALRPSIDAYLAAAREAGHTPNLVYLRPVYLGDSPAEVEREVKGALLNFLAFNASPVRGLPPREELKAKGYAFYASGALESLTRLSSQEIVGQEIAFVGTPDQVVGLVRQLREQVPLAELAVVANFGGLEHHRCSRRRSCSPATSCPPNGNPRRSSQVMQLQSPSPFGKP